MHRYMLTDEGRARIRRRKISVTADMAKIEGYEVLDYLFEHGAGTVEEISSDTGLSQGHVMDKLSVFINHGFVEELAC
jgi:DNA-binding MarR family transcriptional regulator